MNRFALAVLVAVLALVGASSSVFVVHRAQFGAVYAMGRVARVQDQPGLYFKWPSPIENVVLLDGRLRTLRSVQPDAFATRGKADLVTGWFVKWRIQDPKAYLHAFGAGESAADDRIGAALRSHLGADLARLDLPGVLAAQDGELESSLSAQLAKSLRGSGIEVVDAGLTELDFTANATDAVYRRMAAARRLQADQTRAQGQAEAEKIRSEADRQREVLLAQAYRKAQTVKGEGDAQAARIYAASFGKDPEFAAFYRSLEAYRASFDNRSDVLVLDPSSDFFRYMRSPGGKPADSGVHKR